ncbi:MAG: UbiD family decarboxylase [Candidatus Methanogranum gryphiswaldense]|nr:MAG: UbiD family decarboxylase [Candidatus Methanogranum sp. U3.2.1]
MSLRNSLHGDVRKVEENIDPDSGKITKYLMGDQETTFLFTNLNGKKAAGNVFSTRKKIADALNIKPEDIVKSLMNAIDDPKDTKEIKDPEFKTKKMDLDLMKLPIPKYFPEDGGRYITAGIIIAEFDGKRNVSFHRMMIMDKDHIAVRLVPRHLFTMFTESKKLGKELNIAICVGAPAEVLLSAAVAMDYGSDELRVASSLDHIGHGGPLEVGRCDNGILVPSACDYVMEGKITLQTTKEGPFVDITGTYDCIRDQPVIKVDKIWTNSDPCFHILLPGGYDHFLLMGLPREPMIFKTVRQAVPRVKNVRLTEGGCCWLNGIVSITKNKEGDGVNAILAAFTGHPSMKNVIIVDEDIDIFNDREVEWAVATRMQGDRIIKIPGAAGSSLDPSTDSTTYKVGFDATIPMNADRSLFKKATLDEHQIR